MHDFTQSRRSHHQHDAVRYKGESVVSLVSQKRFYALKNVLILLSENRSSEFEIWVKDHKFHADHATWNILKHEGLLPFEHLSRKTLDILELHAPAHNAQDCLDIVQALMQDPPPKYNFSEKHFKYAGDSMNWIVEFYRKKAEKIQEKMTALGLLQKEEDKKALERDPDSYCSYTVGV